MHFDNEKYKGFTLTEAAEWGRINYGNWFYELQNPNYLPQTPAEEFFRYYTQGAHQFFNRIIRFEDIDTYDFSESYFTKEMFDDGIREINLHQVPDGIVVYRYIPKSLIKQMMEWGGSKSIKSGSILIDKGFFSTTLSLEAVRFRDYSNLKERTLFEILVPRGIPSVYVDLVSDMHEQEMLFAPGIKLKVICKSMFGRLVKCMVC